MTLYSLLAENMGNLQKAVSAVQLWAESNEMTITASPVLFNLFVKVLRDRWKDFPIQVYGEGIPSLSSYRYYPTDILPISYRYLGVDLDENLKLHAVFSSRTNMLRRMVEDFPKVMYRLPLAALFLTRQEYCNTSGVLWR
jgi:hypothetical protein